MALDVEQSSLEDEEDQIIDRLDYFGDEDDLHEDCDDEACVGVVRCALSTTVDNDNLKRTSIFYTVIQSGDKKCKLMIDGGSSINVVSKDVVKLLNLKVKPHDPNPFRIAWVNDYTLAVTQRCLVSICKTQENANFLKNGKMVISVKIENFSRSWMTKQTSPLESSREI